ncbi:CsbD family protein [Macrococcus brunensis]|uniref:CsbD family protein n=1 Tax=Macrococcus brunensis TaxID=198483 RepID=A0A4V6PPK7_9STAP|nr:CsbD family protein [Macrococcus brunensis]TDL95237.1 CsbD family protein [Macrococcus brunensis]
MALDGKFDQLKGNVQEKFGEATDNQDLKDKGAENKISGKVKEVTENAKDAVNNKVDEFKNK